MHWDATDHAGFTTGTPWTAINPNHLWLNAANQYHNPNSVFNTYRALIELRHRCPTIIDGTFEMQLRDHPHVYAYTRRLDDHELLVLGNFGRAEQPLPFDQAWAQRLLIGNYPQPHGPPAANSLPALRPWEARVYERHLT
jgi:oligo-1,6-glucosidase